ncbi:extracellular solute-binding protein [Psychrobacillus sp. FSL W7-1457]|uniref:ABC transporter substrate-binding protein n=1 Tax=unclassified Psychrobacillus TaxID=2636677 RepID=UPI0030FA4CD7
MQTKRLMTKIFLLFILSLLVFGCSDETSSNGNKETDGGKTLEEVNLVMYSWRPEDREMYEKAITKFQETYPHIKIDFQPYKSTEYNTILSNALISGDGPDIIQLRPYSGAKSIADNEYLLALDDLNGIDNISETYLDAAKGSDGKVYGVPLSLNAGVIFYNKKLLEENGIKEPKTWVEFIEACKKLKDADIIPIAQSGRAAYLLSMTHGVIAPGAYDNNAYVEKIISGSTNLKDNKFVESVKRMGELKEFFPKDFIALEDSDAQTLFFTEQAAMYINGDYRLSNIETTAPDLPVGIIPGLSNEESEDPAVVTWVDGSYAAVKNSEYQEEAKLFMEFLTSSEFGQIFTNESNRLSAVNGVEPQHPLVKLVSEASEKHSTPYLMLVHFGEGEPTTKTTFENALQGMYLDELSVEAVIQESQLNADRAAGK